MSSKHPGISIIIPAHNSGNLLIQALTSVWNQTFTDRELIVIDGGSTDGTVELLQANKAKIDYWVSETDKGIYDAMNKGIDAATGEWLFFLGSDDALTPNILATMAQHLREPKKIVYGDVLFDNGYRMQSFLGPRTWLQNTLHHQSAFYHRSLFEGFRYDTSLRILADYELNLRAHANSVPVEYVPFVVAKCRTGGASANLGLSLRETNIVRSRYIRNKWKHAGLCAFLWLYYTQKQVRFHLYGHRV